MLELSDVNTYYGESHVLKGVSLTVEGGEVVGLLGRNGAGKTTTVRSITGIQPPESGTIRFDGEEITEKSVPEIANLGIKVVLEERRPFPNLTVNENLQLSVDRTHSDSWTIQRIYNEFDNLDERRDQDAGTLSGGEQQMLAISQALVGNPRIILLDEPFEGLAPQIKESIADVIEYISSEGIPILLIEQNYNFCLELMDRGYLLHKGDITFSGTQEEFIKSEDVVERYLVMD